MTRVPASETLELLQGADLDETWTFWEDDEQTVPTDFTGTVAVLRLAKDAETPAFKTLTSAGPPAAPPGADGLYFSTNNLRIFIRAVTLAAFTEALFSRSECDGDDGVRVFLGLNTLEFTKAGFTSRENQGEIRFVPYAEPGP